jgi:uncharacterized protein
VTWRSAMLATLAASAVQPIPPPVDQVTADCVAPVYASDQLVCADPELKSIDLGYRTERDALGDPQLRPDAIWESDVDWFRRRGRCAFLTAHRECLLAAYGDRRSLIAAISAALRATGNSACQVTGMTAPLHLYHAADGTVVLRNADGIAAVASPEGATRAGWVAFASARPNTDAVAIRNLGGQVLECVRPPRGPPG